MSSKATQRLKIRKGDEVIVVSGRDKGRKGSVLRVIPAERRVIVQGVNIAKRHTSASATQPGGIVDKELPIHVSNVALVDPDGGKATRVGYKFLDDGRKVRIARRSGQEIN